MLLFGRPSAMIGMRWFEGCRWVRLASKVDVERRRPTAGGAEDEGLA